MKKSFVTFLTQIKNAQTRAIQQAEKVGLEGLETFDYKESPPRMIAIDGSNRWIWNNPDIDARIAILRTAHVVYEYNKVSTPQIQLVTQNSKDETVLVAPGSPDIHNYDQEIRKLNTELKGIVSPRNPMEQTISILRSLQEFQMAEKLAMEYSNSLIVMDGALTYVQIKKFETTIQNILRTCASKNNVLIGISKRNTTRRLKSELTDEAIMREIAKNQDKMVYMEIPGIDKSKQKFPTLGTTYLAKLHATPVKTFRVDVVPPKDFDIESIMSHLAYYSQVDSFPGYPFPLVDAHTIAALLRRVPEMYNHDLIEAGLSIGLSEEEIFKYMISHENLEKDPFHRHLDEVTR
ncbi:MAG: DNA double-strand break repair nuclease NurA [Candidatus Hodarchaeales archaeon]